METYTVWPVMPGFFRRARVQGPFTLEQHPSFIPVRGRVVNIPWRGDATFCVSFREVRGTGWLPSGAALSGLCADMYCPFSRVLLPGGDLPGNVVALW